MKVNYKTVTSASEILTGVNVNLSVEHESNQISSLREFGL